MRERNKKLLKEHSISTQDKGLLFAKITVLAEFLFLCCLGFMEYYDYRSYKELVYKNASSNISNFRSNWTKQDLQNFIQQMIDTEMEQKVQPLQTIVMKQLPKEKPQHKTPVVEAPPDLPVEDKTTPVEDAPSKKDLVEDAIIVETAVQPVHDVEDLKKEIRNLRNRMSKAKSRIKKGEGNLETHQATIKSVEEAIIAKSKLLKKIESGQH